MNAIVELILTILRALGIIPKAMPPAPPPSPAPTPLPTPSPLPVVALPITKATAFRQTGMITKVHLCGIVKGTPLEGECGSIHAALGGRALPVAQSYKESRYGQEDNARRTHNPLGLMLLDGSTLATFPSWAAAFSEWARRMDSGCYKSPNPAECVKRCPNP